MQLVEPIRTASDIGSLLKQARIASNLRQRDAADLCGVSERFLIQLEQGKAGSRLELVLKVCQGLGVSLTGSLNAGEPPAGKKRARMRAQGVGKRA